MKTPTVYILNWHYKTERLTAAYTKKEAAEKFGVTITEFRKFAKIVYHNPDLITLSLADPDAIYEKLYIGNNNWKRIS